VFDGIFWEGGAAIMAEDTKNNLKKLAEEAEMKVARSVLRWKYKKEGKDIPPEYLLENESRQIAGHAHEVLAKRGRNVFNELKKVYKKKV
jgi:hypothetical protein